MKYSGKLKPSAPFASVSVRSPFTNFEDNELIDMLIDTGSDASFIPRRLVTEYQKKIKIKLPYGEQTVEDYVGNQYEHIKMMFEINVENQFKDNIFLILFDRDYGIIGRDILNKAKILLNGPDEKIEFA